MFFTVVPNFFLSFVHATTRKYTAKPMAKERIAERLSIKNTAKNSRQILAVFIFLLCNSCMAKGNNPNEKGFAIGENIRWQNPKNQCRIDLGITYFNTDNYNARIYHYEPTLLYSFGSTPYYYKGIRTTLLANLPLVKETLFLNAKFAMTKYFNQDTIGSGLERIDANHREDLQVQVRWKF